VTTSGKTTCPPAIRRKAPRRSLANSFHAITTSAPQSIHDHRNMARTQSLLYMLCSLILFLTCVEALKFEVEAFSRGDNKGERCIRNFVSKETLVVVTATIDGYQGDGMSLNMHVSANANFSDDQS